MKSHATEDVNKFKTYERASASNDPQHYGKEDPGTTRPPKGKRGRPALKKRKHVKEI